MQLSMRRLLFFALTLYPIYSHAQFLLDTVHIPQIDVSARRPVTQLGMVATTIDSAAMAQSGSQNMGELLSTNSPLYIKSYGGSSMATASFRGTAASHTQVIWNGIAVNSSSNGISDLALLPGAFTDEVTLLHGGSSLSQGSGSLGGSIILDNKPQWDKRLHTFASAGAGSFGTYKYLASIGGGSRTVQYKIKALHDASANNYPFFNDEVLPSRDDTMRNANYTKQGILQELYWKSSDKSVLSAQYWHTLSDRNLPPLMSYEGTSAERQQDRAHRGAAKWQRYGNVWQNTFRVGINKTHSQYKNRSTSRDWIINEAISGEQSITATAEAKQTIADGRLLLRYSAGMSRNKVNTDNTVQKTGYRRNRTEYNAGLSAHCRITERLGGYALIRGEYYDRQTAPLTPSLGLDYQLLSDRNLIAKISASRNYHKPTLNDLYYLPGGNPDLLPEDGYSADASLSYSRKGTWLRTDAGTNLYISRISNWIVWEPARSGASYQEAANLRDVLARGCENQLTASSTIGKYTVSVRGLYTYTRTENLTARSPNDRSAGKQLMYIPVHTGGLSASCKRGNVSAGISHHFTGERFTTSSNTGTGASSAYQPNLPGYWLTSAFASMQIDRRSHRWTANLRSDNLFATDYKAVLGRPMPQRSFYFSISWQWAQPTL